MKIGILFGTKPMGNRCRQIDINNSNYRWWLSHRGSSDSDISAEKTDNSRGNIDIWIKIDQSGNIMWQKNIWGSNSDWVQSLIETPDGGYILAGSSHSNISGKKVKIQEAWEILGLKSTIQELLSGRKQLREQWWLCKIYNSHLWWKLHYWRRFVF
jgi:hypothetical protein